MGEQALDRPGSPSGLDATGAWTPSFPGQRPPFALGNGEAVSHGAYASETRLSERAKQHADDWRPHLLHYQSGDELSLRLLGLSLARIEAAAIALEQAKPGELPRLEQDLRGWVNLASKIADRLALSTAARRRLGFKTTNPRPLSVNGADQGTSLVDLHEAAAAEKERSS